MKSKTMLIADAIIGIMTATSSIWVDVNVFHRILIGIVVAGAMQTLFVWLDEKLDNDDIATLERKEANRNKIYEIWRKEMP